MSCSKIESLLIELSLDEPREASRLERAQAHLAECERCRRLLAAHRALGEALDETRRADAWTAPPAELERELTEAFRDQARERARPLWGWAASAVAAAMLAAALIGWDSGERRPDRAAVPQQIPVRVSEFYPLAASGPYDVLDRGRLVRVRLPASAAFDLGIPTHFEGSGVAFEADVLLGDDGVARAIRFVY